MHFRQVQKRNHNHTADFWDHWKGRKIVSLNILKVSDDITRMLRAHLKRSLRSPTGIFCKIQFKKNFLPRREQKLGTVLSIWAMKILWNEKGEIFNFWELLSQENYRITISKLFYFFHLSFFQTFTIDGKPRSEGAQYPYLIHKWSKLLFLSLNNFLIMLLWSCLSPGGLSIVNLFRNRSWTRKDKVHLKQQAYVNR